MKVPCYSEEELLANFSNYREKFRSLFPLQYEHAISEINSTTISQTSQITTTYRNTLDQILAYLNNNSIYNIILQQLLSLRHPLPHITTLSSLTLNEDQYKAYDILTNSWGPDYKEKYPYFFLTGSAGTGKSFLLYLIINYLKSKRINYLLVASTSVAAQNVSGKTIHSALKIKQTGDYYISLSQYDQTTRNNLSKIQAIIIEEISMVSANLFTFISNLFGSIHQNSKIFSGIPTLVVGDLAQLPPLTGSRYLTLLYGDYFSPSSYTNLNDKEMTLLFLKCSKNYDSVT